MDIIPLARIKPLLDHKSEIIDAITKAFISHAKGDVTLPDPVQLMFHGADNILRGDCHVKTAYASQFPYFCIKTATGFYDNRSLNLPVNNGLVLLFSTRTGAPLALLMDEGHLTSARTAAAGAIAARLRPHTSQRRLGIIGTGHQAELQAHWIAHTVPVSALTLYGRRRERAEELCDRLRASGLPATVADTPSQVCAQSDTIVTATPATSPILLDKDIRPGHHIIALGADSPGKIELDPNILARAGAIITDDIAQCVHHGELGHAVRAGLVTEKTAIPLGQVLSIPDWALPQDAISIVDLTGLGAQDLYIAAFVHDALAATVSP